MGTFKKNGKFWVDYYYHGKRIRKPISEKKKDALDYLAKVQTDIMQKRHPMPRDEKIKFIGIAEIYVERHSSLKKSFNSDKSLLKTLVRYFGDYDLSDFALDVKNHIGIYKAARLSEKVRRGKKYPDGKPVSMTTVNRELALLRNILNKAVEWGFLTLNPLQNVKIMFPERPMENILQVKELERLITKAKGNLKNQIIIALNTGMRKGEILNLK